MEKDSNVLNGPFPVPFDYFRLFHKTLFKYKLRKAKMVCLGFESGAAGWKTQTDRVSYGCTTDSNVYVRLSYVHDISKSPTKRERNR